jgi:RhoGAP domain
MGRNLKKRVRGLKLQSLRKKVPIMSAAPRLKPDGSFNRNEPDCPQIVLDLVERIRLVGLSEPGIFREPGLRAKTQILCDAYEVAAVAMTPREKAPVDLAEYTVNDLASSLKSYLRNLDEPLLTYELAPVFEALLDVDDDAPRSALLMRHIKETDPRSLKKRGRKRRTKTKGRRQVGGENDADSPIDFVVDESPAEEEWQRKLRDRTGDRFAQKDEGHSLSVDSVRRRRRHSRDPIADAATGKELFEAMTDDAREALSADIRVERAQFVVENLPPGCRLTAQCTFRLLHEVSQNSEQNHMTPRNLAVCIGPSVYSTRSMDPSDMLASSHVSEQLCTLLVGRYSEIFPSAPVDSAKRLREQPYNKRIFSLAAKGMLEMLRQDIKDQEKLERLRVVSEKTGVPIEEIDLDLYNRTLGKQLPEKRASRRHLFEPEDKGTYVVRTHTRRRGLTDMARPALIFTQQGSGDAPPATGDDAAAASGEATDAGATVEGAVATTDAPAETTAEDAVEAPAQPELEIEFSIPAGSPAAVEGEEEDGDDDPETEERAEAARCFWDESDDSYDEMELPDLPQDPEEPQDEEDAGMKTALEDIRLQLGSLSFVNLHEVARPAAEDGSQSARSANSKDESADKPSGGLLSQYRAKKTQRELDKAQPLMTGGQIDPNKVSYDNLYGTWSAVKAQAQTQGRSVQRVKTFRDMHKMLDDVIMAVEASPLDDELDELDYTSSEFEGSEGED